MTYQGKVWCSVSEAARYLRTRHEKIRILMGAGSLTYTQVRKSGSLYVLVEDLVNLKRIKLYGASGKPAGK